MHAGVTAQEQLSEVAEQRAQVKQELRQVNRQLESQIESRLSKEAAARYCPWKISANATCVALVFHTTLAGTPVKPYGHHPSAIDWPQIFLRS